MNWNPWGVYYLLQHHYLLCITILFIFVQNFRNAIYSTSQSHAFWCKLRISFSVLESLLQCSTMSHSSTVTLFFTDPGNTQTYSNESVTISLFCCVCTPFVHTTSDLYGNDVTLMFCWDLFDCFRFIILY